MTRKKLSKMNQQKFFKIFKNIGKNIGAFSLLELLVALSVFSFLFLFITQLVRQNHRQAAKIKKDLKMTGSIYHTVNLIQYDLFASAYFLDLNLNFRTYFPLKKEETALPLLSPFLPQAPNTPALSDSKNNKTLFLDSEVVFKGESREMEFVSYSFSKKSPFKQWMKIRYAAENCPVGDSPGDSPGGSSGLCLMRYEKPIWNSSEELKWEEPGLVVMEALESINFFYSDSYSLTDPEWEEEWEAESVQNASLEQETLEEPPLPVRVQIDFKRKDSSSAEQWVFPVSQVRLKEWSPYFKGFSSFEEWKPPKKEPAAAQNPRAGDAQTSRPGR